MFAARLPGAFSSWRSGPFDDSVMSGPGKGEGFPEQGGFRQILTRDQDYLQQTQLLPNTIRTIISKIVFSFAKIVLLDHQLRTNDVCREIRSNKSPITDETVTKAKHVKFGSRCWIVPKIPPQKLSRNNIAWYAFSKLFSNWLGATSAVLEIRRIYGPKRAIGFLKKLQYQQETLWICQKCSKCPIEPRNGLDRCYRGRIIMMVMVSRPFIDLSKFSKGWKFWIFPAHEKLIVGSCELARKYHPDKNKEPGADEVFKLITSVYPCNILFFLKPY